MEFRNDRKLCVVRNIKVFISCTKKLQEILSTAIEFSRPYGPIFRDTLPNWTHHVLASASLDMDVYGTLNQRGLKWV